MDFHTWLVLCVVLMCVRVGTTLNCACEKDKQTCVSFSTMRVDFQTAQEQCQAEGGNLLKQWSADFAHLLRYKAGRFWIGDNGMCLNTDTRLACSNRCVSVSKIGQEEERSCEEHLDGFICYGVRWQSCWMESQYGVLMLSKKDCAEAPCEHNCDVAPRQEGYICSCFQNFRPSKISPEKCTYYCNSSPCAPQCRARVPSCDAYCSDLGGSLCTDAAKCPSVSACEQKCSCECPDGFVYDEKMCVDIDECVSNHDCRHQCRNTRGSYTCSCRDGYKRVNRSECVPRLRSLEGLNASLNYTISKAWVETPVEYVVLIVIVVLVILALIAISYCKRRKVNVGLNNCDVLDNARTQEEL